jgi:hypothetical protein
MNWAFMYPRGLAAKQYLDQISYNLDVLITHGPPLGSSLFNRYCTARGYVV